MDELLDAVLTLVGTDFAVEVLAADDVGRQLAPGGRHFAVVLLEQHFTILALDRRGAGLPLGCIKRAVDVGRAEVRIELHPPMKTLHAA